jgi:hypothetical protein
MLLFQWWLTHALHGFQTNLKALFFTYKDLTVILAHFPSTVHTLSHVNSVGIYGVLNIWITTFAGATVKYRYLSHTLSVLKNLYLSHQI